MTLEEIRLGSILLFNKPFDWSSFDVVNRVKHQTHAKVGHAGTLDPYATGLLILCTGKFTKRISEFQNSEKEYTGTMVIGKTTPSYDMETEVNQQFAIDEITEEKIYSTAKLFSGEIEQAPPVYSAIYSEGRRAYKMAREGLEFELTKRTVTLMEFEIIAVKLPEVQFRIVCGKGFYVRSLVNDFGKALGNGAYLSSLCRTRIGAYKLEDAWQMADFTTFVRGEKEKTV